MSHALGTRGRRICRVAMIPELRTPHRALYRKGLAVTQWAVIWGPERVKVSAVHSCFVRGYLVSNSCRLIRATSAAARCASVDLLQGHAQHV